MGEIAYIDGKMVPLTEAKVSIFDRGFLYGDGLFETIRIYQRSPFLLEKHLKRLLSSAQALKINSPECDELESIVDTVISTNRIEEGVLKIILTRGVGERGLSFSDQMKPTLIIAVAQGVPHNDHMYRQGFSAIFVPEVRSFGYLKSLNFLANVMAKSFADDYGAQEALFVKDGFVTEGTMSNVFVVMGGKLTTPPLSHRILAGVTREHVFNLAAELEIDFSEVSLLREELEESEEVFITNSIIEIMPIVRLEQKKVGSGIPGEITLWLREKYRESVGQYLSKQD